MPQTIPSLSLNSLKSQLNRHYQELEARLAEDGKGNGQLNKTHLSTTDPDASLVSKGKVRSQLSFKVHRAVDEQGRSHNRYRGDFRGS